VIIILYVLYYNDIDKQILFKKVEGRKALLEYNINIGYYIKLQQAMHDTLSSRFDVNTIPYFSPTEKNKLLTDGGSWYL